MTFIGDGPNSYHNQASSWSLSWMTFIGDRHNSYLNRALNWSPSQMMDIGDGLLLWPDKDIIGYLCWASICGPSMICVIRDGLDFYAHMTCLCEYIFVSLFLGPFEMTSL